MKKCLIFVRQLPVYLFTFGACILIAAFFSTTATVMAENEPADGRLCIIIDAGHGGEDGGAVSCSGVFESRINLQIALKLNDLMRLLGYKTKMIRTEDISVYTEGETIAARKMSDLKNRTQIINSTPNACLVSIHQNSFLQARYSGAQIFYSKSQSSKELAEKVQQTMIAALNPGSNRKVKNADGIYLMEHIACPGILVECGFLSNPEEEAKLRTDQYQLKTCCAIASPLAMFLES